MAKHHMQNRFDVLNDYFEPLVARRSISLLCLSIMLFFTQTDLYAQNSDTVVSLPIDKFTDEQGNRVPDFSHCGYRGNDVALPDALPLVSVAPEKGDDGARIQAALDYSAMQPLGANGLRGAVLLRAGTYQVEGSLRINASGVVLRGSGAGAGGTVIEATGLDRRALIELRGVNDRKKIAEYQIASDTYIPCGSYQAPLADASGLRARASVSVTRSDPQEWIDSINIGRAFNSRKAPQNWRRGQLSVVWEREIESVEGNVVALDAPLTLAIEPEWGGGFVETFEWPGRIHNAGVQDLRLVSVCDPARPLDEDHAWTGIVMENVRDAWVARVVFEHFAGSAVALWETVSRVTVQDCRSLAPVSENGGWRRHTFYTAGGQTLFLRCFAERGRHDFATGHFAPGPNAFVHCDAREALDDSGPIGAWSSGVLYDNVNIDGNALRLADRGTDLQFARWAAVNCMIWQSTASNIDCYKPPVGQNWAIGCWAITAGDGHWESENDFVNPKSLMRALTDRRLGRAAGERIGDGVIHPPGSTSPTYDQAAEMVARSNAPAPQLIDLIDAKIAEQQNKILASIQSNPSTSTTIKTLEELRQEQPDLFDQPQPKSTPPLKLTNGWLTIDGKVAAGTRAGTIWWRGSIVPAQIDRRGAGIGVTRFVPGRTGRGFTDDFDELTGDMLANGQIALEHHHGLWYDRRRDDHERVRRIDGEVWPPFYELPYARSGQGAAWDGLSKYDLTKFNLWYFERLDAFAAKCGQRGLVLIAQHYFQHNIIEAGAHWADYPWRSANNINGTGFPEPPPYAGDKRIFQAHLFYDINHPVRRPLHELYIRHYLDVLSDRPNVIQLLGEEFTGPLHFMQFWLDTCAAWEKETGKAAIIGLSATKDVQDAILADPARAAIVDVIDIRYWWYQDNGAVYAPKGGKSLAMRQHARQLQPKNSSFAQIARAVHEYRRRFPDKAVIYSADGADHNGWAVVIGGGSLPAALPGLNDAQRAELATLRPFALTGNADESHSAANAWALVDPGRTYVVYTRNGASFTLDLTGATGQFNATWLNPESSAGEPIEKETLSGGGKIKFEPPVNADCLLCLKRI